MAREMFTGLLFFLLYVTSTSGYYYFKGKAIADAIVYINTSVTLDHFTPRPVIKQPVIPANAPPQKLKPQIKFVPPVVVVPDEVETSEDLPPGVDELKNNDIGAQT
jgi:hypothetical protein